MSEFYKSAGFKYAAIGAGVGVVIFAFTKGAEKIGAGVGAGAQDAGIGIGTAAVVGTAAATSPTWLPALGEFLAGLAIL